MATVAALRKDVKKYIKKIYNTDVYRIPYYLLVEKDDSKFIELKN